MRLAAQPMTASGSLAVTSSGARHHTAADRGDKKREDPQTAAMKRPAGNIGTGSGATGLLSF
jgi:hypothetical protein